MDKGRKKGISNGQNLPNKSDCFFCEGTQLHFGSECKACNGTGKESTRRQLQKVHNSINNLPINQDINQ